MATLARSRGASYAPGESYLVVSHMHHLHERHHVVPAGALEDQH
jgi:hypothetical protein